jgi:hypothetical protein
MQLPGESNQYHQTKGKKMMNNWPQGKGEGGQTKKKLLRTKDYGHFTKTKLSKIWFIFFLINNRNIIKSERRNQGIQEVQEKHIARRRKKNKKKS